MNVFNFIERVSLLFAATAAVVILAIAASLLIQASTAPASDFHAGCYHVVDVAGKDWWLKTQPVFDVRSGAIQFDSGYSTGWIWPSSLEVTHRCLDVPAT